MCVCVCVFICSCVSGVLILGCLCELLHNVSNATSLKIIIGILCMLTYIYISI